MPHEKSQQYSAFDGFNLLVQGSLEAVVLMAKANSLSSRSSTTLIFSDSTGKQMDFDLSGSKKDVLKRLEVYVGEEPMPSQGPGRPKLGVMSREVSLLPRHWEWLSTQSGGASATLRRLVDGARKQSSDQDQTKRCQDRTYKFLSAIAGDLPYYEEVLRALFAKDQSKFKAHIDDWPRDIKNHALQLAKPIFK